MNFIAIIIVSQVERDAGTRGNQLQSGY